MLPKLTESQEKVLGFIREHYESTGVSPSYREIQKHFGYKAVGTVQDHVKALVKKGRLEQSAGEGRARGWLPTGYRAKGSRRLGVYGEIAAGSPRDSEQVPMGSVVVSEDLAGDSSFALRVTGDSMVDVGIYEGDFLVVERTHRVKTGDIVVALLDGETTVKRYKKTGQEVWLVPENAHMEPISTRDRELEIQGKVVALQRRLV